MIFTAKNGADFLPVTKGEGFGFMGGERVDGDNFFRIIRKKFSKQISGIRSFVFIKVNFGFEQTGRNGVFAQKTCIALTDIFLKQGSFADFAFRPKKKTAQYGHFIVAVNACFPLVGKQAGAG